MEYGLIPKIDQYQDNKALEIQKIEGTKETSKVTREKGLEALQEEYLKASEVQKAKEVTASDIQKFEVTLTNFNFGFNDKSKDFYVKAIRGDAENQYPTEEMMRLKAYLMAQNEKIAQVEASS